MGPPAKTLNTVMIPTVPPINTPSNKVEASWMNLISANDLPVFLLAITETALHGSIPMSIDMYIPRPKNAIKQPAIETKSLTMKISGI